MIGLSYFVKSCGHRQQNNTAKDEPIISARKFFQFSFSSEWILTYEVDGFVGGAAFGLAIVLTAGIERKNITSQTLATCKLVLLSRGQVHNAATYTIMW